MNVRCTRASMLTYTAAAAAALLPPPSSAQSRVLRIGTDPFDAYAEPLYAQQLGLFKKAGLDVEVTTLTNGATLMNGVASGALDVGISNPVQLANAVEHGIPLTLIAGAGMYSTNAPTTVLCVAKNSSLRTGRDLNGKTIAVTALKDMLVASASAWLSGEGADPGTVRFIELPFSQMGAALQRGTVDAAMIAEPAVVLAIDRGEARIFAKAFDVIAPRFYIGTFFSTTSFVQSNPAAVNTLIKVIYDTARWANKNPEASADILISYAKLPAVAARRMNRAVYSESLNPSLLQPILDISFKYGILAKPITASQLIARI